MVAKKDPRTPAQVRLAKQLGAALGEARRVAGITQDELAWKCDLHRAYMGFIEQGRYSITLATLVQVCEKLGVKPSDILKKINL
ncbi:MAG: helix-turn-helix domain-containing protein [Opitutaceae bacterium]|nr:helix-turn-helix domain-containing protein [Opitutaceae bacterium]